MRLWELYNLVAILVEFDMDSHLLFPPNLRRSLGLWSTSQFGSCREKLIPKVWSCLSVVCYQRYSLLLCTLYNLFIIFWYYPLFVAICEIWLLRLTYGAYLVLSLKSGITVWPSKSFESHLWWSYQWKSMWWSIYLGGGMFPLHNFSCCKFMMPWPRYRINSSWLSNRFKCTL